MRRSGLMHIGELIARNGTGVNPKWELDVEMQRGCRFDITREVKDNNE
jgi:hypothetical protein